MTQIQEIVNIGPALAHDLRAVGIAEPEQLLDVGAADAWERLYAAGLRDCVQSRLALEGAVRGVRWTALEPDVRDVVARTVTERAPH